MEQPLVLGRHQLAVRAEQPRRAQVDDRVIERPGALGLALVDADHAEQLPLAADVR